MGLLFVPLIIALLYWLWLALRGPQKDLPDFSQARNLDKLEASQGRVGGASEYQKAQSARRDYVAYMPADLDDGRWVGWNFCGRLDVAGTQHHAPDSNYALLSAKEGDFVELRRAPANEHDPNAIEVWFGAFFVGFIDRITAESVASYLPNEMPICARYVNGWLGETGFLRLTIQPLMPDAKTRRRNGWTVHRRA